MAECDFGRGPMFGGDAVFRFENSYTTLPEIFYTYQAPAKFPEARIVALNKDLAHELGLDTKSAIGESDFGVLNGEPPEGSKPIAQAYAGHQFGNFRMLGDGRAVLLGEHSSPKGIYDVQLKGSGATPYSRNGDGLASIGPMLREYIISEAMHHLGVPTTRSLAVMETGQDRGDLKGAILVRVASSHIRVGTFSYASAFGTMDDVQKLADYTMARHYPDIQDGSDKYLEFFRQACARQAHLIAQWQLLGFIHGVMNTDNMAVSGETIDYGQCAFMEEYDPSKVFSSIDQHGRYAYKNQPTVGGWNLAVLADAMLPLLHQNEHVAVELVQEVIEGYFERYKEAYKNGMMAKIGLSERRKGDDALIHELLRAMEDSSLDYTHTFHSLSLGDVPKGLEGWDTQWRQRISFEADPFGTMGRANPATIPRNAYVEEALAAAEEGDYAPVGALMEAIRNPYSQSDYTQPKPSGEEYKTFCGT